MNLWQGALTALDSLSSNKMRSGLTILGIVIGVGAVIALVSIGRGAQASITSQIQSQGTNLIFVRPGSVQQGGAFGAAGGAATLTLEDSNALVNLPGISSVAPEVDGRAQVAYLSANSNTRAIGVTPEYANTVNFQIASGDFISAANVTGRSLVAVLGANVANTLFGDPTAGVGQTIRVNSQPYRVIGVLVAKGGTGFGNQDDQIMVPLSTAQTRLLGGNRFRGANVINSITIQAASADQVQSTIDAVTQALRDRHHTAVGSDDFTVQNQADILATATQVTNTLTVFLGGIAAISLLVGGIGIMNIMLVSVTERTREIGVRKALGARRRDILYQFLVESATLSLLGGLIGVLLGWVISELVGRVQLGGAAITPQVSADAVLLATGFSIAIGLFFGIYPATRAAALQPIEALRHD
jgi:putative ABC transport system permease protein